MRVLSALITVMLVSILLVFALKDVDSIGKYGRGVNGALELVVRIEKPNVKIGETLNITLRLRNAGVETVVLHYRNSHVIEVYLYDKNGELVTFLTKGCGFSQVLTDIILEPGEAKEWNILWTRLWREEEIQSGKYYLQGEVLYAVRTSLVPIMICA